MSTINYDDTNLGTDTYSVEVIEPWPVPGTPQPRTDVQAVPHGGGIIQGAWKQPLVMPVTVAITGTSMDDVRDKLTLIARVFNVTSDKYLYFDGTPFSGRRWKARRTAPLAEEWISPQGIICTWQFTMPDATAESRELFEDDSAPTSNGYTFYVPTAAAAVVGGDSDAYPIFIIKATGNCVSPQLANITTGKTLNWAATLTNGQWLRINTDPNILSVERSTDGGTSWTSVIANQSGPFPRLRSGVRNEYLLSNCDLSTLEVDWRARYSGG